MKYNNKKLYTNNNINLFYIIIKNDILIIILTYLI